MEPKLTVLFVLIGVIIGFSHLRAESLGRIRQLARTDWRHILQHRAKR
jgi:hypothetical protein